LLTDRGWHCSIHAFYRVQAEDRASEIHIANVVGTRDKSVKNAPIDTEVDAKEE